MGMFDWYQPDPPIVCDGLEVVDWQGGDGPCALYVWRQHFAAPVDQVVDSEVRGRPEVMEASRLPEGESTIHATSPSDSKLLFATIVVKDGVWIETKQKSR